MTGTTLGAALKANGQGRLLDVAVLSRLLEKPISQWNMRELKWVCKLCGNMEPPESKGDLRKKETWQRHVASRSMQRRLHGLVAKHAPEKSVSTSSSKSEGSKKPTQKKKEGTTDTTVQASRDGRTPAPRPREPQPSRGKSERRDDRRDHHDPQNGIGGTLRAPQYGRTHRRARSRVSE